jgi:hypothetical protein
VYTFFSAAHGTFSKTAHIFGHKRNINGNNNRTEGGAQVVEPQLKTSVLPKPSINKYTKN